jgi:hypothetical protein
MPHSSGQMIAGVVAGGEAEAGVAVDQLGGPAHHRDVGQDGADEAAAHRRPAHRRDDRLGAVDHVVDHVAGLAQVLHAHLVVADHLVDHLEVAAGAEGVAGAREDHRRHRVVVRDLVPDPHHLRMHDLVDRVLLARVVHRDAQHPGVGAIEAQALETGVVGVGVGHVGFSPVGFSSSGASARLTRSRRPAYYKHVLSDY